MANIVDGTKRVISGFKKLIQHVKNIIKLALSKVGFVIICLILIAILVIIFAFFFRSIHHLFGMLFNPDYPGISSDEDYKYISSSISYANYDSLISDKNYQEYMAYEYAMLMDVAEFIYKGQNELDYSKSENAGHYKTVKKSGDEILEDRKSPDYMPYLKVRAEYNLDKMSHEQWQAAVIAGQGSERYGYEGMADFAAKTGSLASSAEDLKALTTGHDVYGGNKNVTPPVLTYEFHTNQYDEDKGSLVPYITVIKEDKEYDYYTVRGIGENGGRNKYDKAKSGAYAENGINDGVIIDDSNIGDINLMTTYKDYNLHNYYLGSAPDQNETPSGPGYPNSNVNSNKAATIDAKEEWPISDEDPKNSLFYTGFGQKQVYKIPLQTLIDRYMPKAALLASWHFAKDNDYADREKTTGNPGEAKSTLLANNQSIFDVTELIGDIKGIYNYYCLHGEMKNNGKEWTVNDATHVQDETVPSLSYDEYGSVIRNDSGEPIEGAEATRHIENDKQGNNVTFLRFGQAGLENNRFGIYTFYDPETSTKNGPKGDKDITGAEDNATVPIISDLISRSGEFLDTMHFHLTYYFEHLEEDGKNPDGSIKYKTVRDGPYQIDKDYQKDAAEGKSKDDFIYANVPMDETGTPILSGHIADDVNQRISTSGFSQFILHDVIKPAEIRYQKDSKTLEAMTEPIRNDKKKLVNNEYIYPEETYIPDGKEDIKAKRIEFVNINDYDYDVAFYDYSFFKDLGIGESLVTKHVLALCGEKEQEIIEQMGMPQGAILDKFWYDDPEYRQISSYPEPQNAIYAITEETIALTMDVQHRRSPIMAVTKAYTWVKEIDYDITLEQNSFDPDNYKHVIPHSNFSRGLSKIEIIEKSKYRTDLFRKYFSSPENDPSKPPALKENDVLNMMQNWETSASNGIDTGYVYIRDLYKLTMLLREDGKIHENAYDYMYVPMDIWDFNDGVTQSAYWTNILGSGVGNEDTLSYQELRTMKVKKPVLTWQQVNYDQYEECLKGGSTAAVYGLYPLGSEFARAYWMENALYESGEFYDGNYTTGHKGADWQGRYKIQNISEIGDNLKYGQESIKQTIEAKIYNYELKRRTLQKIMQLGFKEDYRKKVANSYLNGGGDTEAEGYARSAYAMAKGELDAELMKQSINSPIVAAAAGVVVEAGWGFSPGFYVKIDHTAEQNKYVTTTYCHMRRWPEVQVGDEVGPGTLLGYEGTTGNSGGWHVHMDVKAHGEKEHESPAAYFGPIFSPFYDKDKAGEVLKHFSSNEILALSSDYFSLIRTVLLAKFNSTSLVENITATPVIPTAIFIRASGDESSEYVIYPNSDVLFSGDRLILKEIGLNIRKPNYWECQVENYEDVLKEKKEQLSEEDFKELKNSISAILLTGRNIYKVKSKTKIELSDNVGVQGGSIKVRTKPGGPKSSGGGAHEVATVQWGNNTPLWPLFQDVSMSYDINLLRVQKTYERGQYDELGAPTQNFQTDISVWSKLFDEKSAPVIERLNNSRKMFPFVADMDSPYAVPIYDGPVSIEMYEALVNDPDSYGLAGTNSGDLQKLQIAMRAKGFDPEHKMNVDGVFDVETAETIKRASLAMTEAGFDSGNYFVGQGLEGRLGVVGSIDNNGNLDFVAGADKDGSFAWRRYFGTTVVTNWNAYVTYGTKDNTIKASEGALSNASLQTGIHYSFLCAIAERESSLINRAESQEPVYYAPFTGSFNGRYAEAPAGAPSTEALIKYRGEMKVVRRAQGLMQFIWGSALGKGAAHGFTTPEEILDAVRMPNTSALFAADEFQGFILKFKRNKIQLATIRNIAKLSAWTAAAKDAKVDPQTLVMYAMCCYRYQGNRSDPLFADNDKGSFSTSAIQNLSNSTYNKETKTFKSGGGSVYFADVINKMIDLSK